MAGHGSKTVIYAALVGNALIAVTKFFASAMTGSSAMLSEGIHSLVDTGNQGLLLYGMRRAQRPADAEFPFGHGKEIYFWSFVVSILIFGLGGGISLYEGIHHIQHPGELGDPSVNYIVLALALVFEGGAWWMAFRAFNAERGDLGWFDAVHAAKDPTNFVVLFEDSAAMLGLLVALAGVAGAQYTGMAVLDGVASCVIGVILAGTAIWLAYETKSLLIGESASGPVVARIRELVREHDLVEEVYEVLTMHVGPTSILVNLRVAFRSDTPAAEVAGAIDALQKSIRACGAPVRRVFIEVERHRG